MSDAPTSVYLITQLVYIIRLNSDCTLTGSSAAATPATMASGRYSAAGLGK